MRDELLDMSAGGRDGERGAKYPTFKKSLMKRYPLAAEPQSSRRRRAAARSTAVLSSGGGELNSRAEQQH
ncbi:hypothetical protein MTO96_013013 [Rhipicephalus appendiculatus]